MKVSIIAAYDMMRVIGHEGKIPWHIPADLKRFKELTLGKPIIMGRKTFESIGRPLAGRLNIILTNKPQTLEDKYGSNSWFHDTTKMKLVSTYEQALFVAKESGAEHSFVIGGEAVYKEAMKTANDMYITYVFSVHEGDAHFPEYSCKDWVADAEIWERGGQNENEDEEGPDYAFCYLKRAKPGFIKLLGSKIAGVFKKASPTKHQASSQ